MCSARSKGIIVAVLPLLDYHLINAFYMILNQALLNSEWETKGMDSIYDDKSLSDYKTEIIRQ